MSEAPGFAADVLDQWRREREVLVETSAGPDALVHRTIIWIVVGPDGRVLVRSYRGPTARWYREATTAGRGAIVTGGEPIEVVFEPATDADRVAACSAELARKYAGDPATAKMLRDEVLDTTLELRVSVA